jgi:NADPH-dependent curcumin reductase CurA
LTAYFGLLHVGKVQAGDTVLISAAAGAVGSIAGQIARIKGCTVIGIAGGNAKGIRLIEEYGFDGAIDYHGLDAAQLAAAIREKAPQGIDLYFDNVGGIHLDAALENMNWQGRIAACGTISEYDGGDGTILRNLFRIVGKTLSVQGFLVFTFAPQFPTAIAALSTWLRDGKLRFSEDIEEGLENAVGGFLKVFRGENTGKAMVRIV